MSFDQFSDSENDNPNWLDGLQPDEGNDAFESDSPENSSPEAREGAPSAQDAGVPDWLTKIRKQEKSSAEEEPPLDTGSLSPEDKKDTADWLEKIRIQYARDTGQLEMPAESPPDKKEPADYMERVQALKEQEQPPAGDNAWLDSGTGEQAAPTQAQDQGWGPADGGGSVADLPAGIWENGETSEGSEEAGPDWLSGLPSISTDMLDEDTVKPEQIEEDQSADWLEGVGPVEKETADQAPDFASTGMGLPGFDVPPPTPEFTQERPPAREGAMPNWLENLKFSPEDSKTSGGPSLDEVYAEEDVSSLLFEADDLPEWLTGEIEEGVEENKGEPSVPPLSTDEAIEEPVVEDGDIAPAELPSWLQAMRPIEAAPDKIGARPPRKPEAGEVEESGPLAGLADVLPAELHILRVGTPSVPVAGFELSPAQKNYTVLLKSMIDAEAVAPPVTRRSLALPQQFLRWIISLLLMVVVFAGAFINDDYFKLPTQTIPPEEGAVVNHIEQLRQGDQVLVAFEYQPGFTGEMEAAAESVLGHVLRRGVSLSLVSTQPTGPDMAERFLQDKLFQFSQVASGQYTNLGYLSGGAAGLANFAASPAVVTGTGTVRNIRDYQMVLVITDDPELARTWVEQVQPFLDPGRTGTGTPLVMVVSAQAEPLVYPFYLSSPKQVSGIVAGVVGGVYYEYQVSGQPGTAQSYWFTYNLALLIAVVLIGGISMINLVGVMVRGFGKSAQRGRAS